MLWGGLLMPAPPVLAQLVVIVNARAGVAELTRNEVVNIFFGRHRQYFNGTEAQPVDVAGVHAERADFYRRLVNKPLADIDAYWSRFIFSGKVRPPAQVRTPEEVVQWVADHPGGIGYARLHRADARVRVVYDLAD